MSEESDRRTRARPTREDALSDAQAAIDEARRRVAEAPAEVVVVNHVMGLYELAAIHLSADQPDLASAALAIDAVACLVEGLGDRLGAEAATMRDALANIRMAFVEIKGRTPHVGLSRRPVLHVRPDRAGPRTTRRSSAAEAAGRATRRRGRRAG